jgi:hypothetical protein
MRTTVTKSARLAREIEQWQAKLAPRLPGIDPHDLQLVLWSVLRRKYERRARFQPVPPSGRRYGH